jgi:hypothetical protein
VRLLDVRYAPIADQIPHRSETTLSANRRLTQRSNYQLFARVRSVVNAQKESGNLSSRPKTGSGKTRDWKSIQEKPVEDTTARLSF